jgi:acetyl esterase
MIICYGLKVKKKRIKNMNQLPSSQPSIDPIMQKFLNNINSQGGTPIYELSPADARNVLLKVQDVNVTKLPVDIEDITIPVGPKGKTNIRIIRPKGNMLPFPAIMYFHGGGWILGDTSTHDRLVREIANGVQAAVIFVDFDRSPEDQYLVLIEEAYAATKYISENGKSLNIDSTRLAVVGDSVGGNMAAVVTILAKERSGPKIDYQVLFYPVTAANFETESYKEFANGYWLSKEAMKWFWNAYLPDENERKKYTASPLLSSIDQLKGLPPALVITNEYDVLRDEGEAYAHKLIEAGVRTTAVRLLGTIHDCLLLNALADASAVQGAIELANTKLRQAFS